MEIIIIDYFICAFINTLHQNVFGYEMISDIFVPSPDNDFTQKARVTRRSLLVNMRRDELIQGHDRRGSFIHMTEQMLPQIKSIPLRRWTN